jgi:hypothetical protein
LKNGGTPPVNQTSGQPPTPLALKHLEQDPDAEDDLEQLEDGTLVPVGPDNQHLPTFWWRI